MTDDTRREPIAALLLSLRRRPDFIRLEASQKRDMQYAIHLLDRGPPDLVEDFWKLRTSLMRAHQELRARKSEGLFPDIELPPIGLWR